MNKQEKKTEAASIEPTLHVGKSGIESVVEELKIQLKNRNMVKIKILKSAFAETGKKELAQKLADLSNSELIEVRGNTAVLCRKR
ncbi:MAG: CRS1 / YhbY (CRM) domain protein [Candidatus Methanoperedens nitroreducens]|uniref:CRS1 / YhbY (CRM) domain protein n=1 Tax=Candidatus Methanoperedens nitratireducens TaxID=1392998 RepID=A0A0P8CM14_9EURY|nr:YhbY family RNA-binding protein [Candidatus Methanoperedens sp. BLZ2]KAB2944437.1 MAG: YhbY family RNA-binding protein [Candidatus Methanoperedens sp.]KPQ44380.1 MAG: CRS1 / YhbY (CRM) domain protein [Candidatus Methanoperedens sp. BLZ1]MCX9079754.1 YhbY family RNA-binding protein [Candidatus Methanoperedens sp.]